MFFRHLACEENRSDICHLLIQHGADTTLLNKDKQTAIDLAPKPLQNSLQQITQ